MTGTHRDLSAPRGTDAGVYREQHVALYGRIQSPDAYELRNFLARSVVSYEFVDVDAGGLPPAERQEWENRLPVCVLPSGEVVLDATIDDVANRLGWIQEPSRDEYDLSIYGTGPAGLSAAVYASSEGLTVALVEKDAVGGQAGWTTRIENYLGFPEGISGAELTERARQQAVRFGVELLQMREGINGQFRDGRIVVDLADGGTLVARANICATGVEYRRLGLKDEDRYLNAGLYYGAGLSETEACKDSSIVIVGGGNSAGQAALHLSQTSAWVDVLIRGTEPARSMSSYLLDRLVTIDNVRLRTETVLTSVEGDHRVRSAVIESGGRAGAIDTSHVFVLIGGVPNTDWADGTGIERDEHGYLLTGADLLSDGALPERWPLDRAPMMLETSVPGSFAAGDVRHGSTKRVASAVGEGAMAVHMVHRWLEERHRE